MNSISKITVEINGKPLVDFENISINQNMYGIDNFEISCRFETLEKRDEFLIEKSKDFLGMPIVIQTTTEINDNEEDCLFFKGYVTEIKGRRSGMSDNDQIVISGGSEEILLNRKPLNRAFIDKSLEDIVKEVLKPYPIKSKIKPRLSQKYSYLVQFEESDLDFLRRLSTRYGEWFFYTGKELIFGEIPELEQMLTIGYNLEEFNYELRVNPVKFNLLSVKPTERKVLKYKSGASSVDSNMNIYGKHAFKQSEQLYPEEGKNFYEHLNLKDEDYKNGLEKVGELDELTDAINLTDLSGTSKNGALVPGMRITVNSPKEKGTETTGYGMHLITSVQHVFDNLLSYSNYFTAIPAESTVPEYTDTNFIRRSGTQVAEVKDNRDPEKLGRLKVKFPWMEKDQTTPWIIVTTPYVGIDWGFYFIPPKNAGVYCDFEAGDVERPYCTGAYFDKQVKPDPEWTGNYREQDAKKQVIRTSSGNTIEFEDVSSSAGKIKIYTANNENYVTLDNENGALKIHSNGTLKMDADKIDMKAKSGISIKSEKELTIVAQKKMEVQAMDTLDLTTAQSVNFLFGSDVTYTIGGQLNGTIGSAYTLMIGGSSSTTIAASTTITSGGSMTLMAPAIKIN